MSHSSYNPLTDPWYDRKTGTSEPGDPGSVDWNNVTSKPATFPPAGHDHNLPYYRKSEIDSTVAGRAATVHSHAIAEVTDLEAELGGKASVSHNHDALYNTKAEVTTLLSGKAATSHNHDAAYNTKAEVTTLLSSKSDTGHGHAVADVTGLQGALDGKEASGAVSAHVAASDPHSGYQLRSEKGAAGGYASLGADGKVPAAQLGSDEERASFSGNGPVYIRARKAMTLSSPSVAGAGTPAVAYSYAADGVTFPATAVTFPLTMAVGSVLRVTLSGFNTWATWDADRT